MKPLALPVWQARSRWPLSCGNGWLRAMGDGLPVGGHCNDMAL